MSFLKKKKKKKKSLRTYLSCTKAKFFFFFPPAKNQLGAERVEMDDALASHPPVYVCFFG